MLIVCDGMPRSASTWSFNVVLALLRRSQPGCEVHSGYDENSANFLESIPTTAEHAVLKCHGLGAEGRRLVSSGVARAIYTWRDPTDAVVSCMRMFGYDFEHSLAAIDSSLELYERHREWGGALVIDYERIVSAQLETVREVAVFLELDLGPGALKAIAEQMSIGLVRHATESIAGSARLVDESGLEYDPETLLHRSHIRDGSSGYGRKALTAEQLERLDATLRDHDLP